MSEDQTWAAVYLPVDLDVSERDEWCSETLSELLEAPIAAVTDADTWMALLQTAASEPLPEAASGGALLITPAQPPTYLWVTMTQPAGAPTRLGDAVLDTQQAGGAAPPPSELAPAGQLYQRVRGGWVRQTDGSPVFVQTSVTAMTLTLPGFGPTDVCLWFNSYDPVGAEVLQVAAADIARSDDLITYLTSA